MILLRYAGRLTAALTVIASISAPLDAQRPRPRPDQPVQPIVSPAVAGEVGPGLWFTMNGGRFHAAADPSRPAILLVHALHQSAHSWTKPSASPKGSRWYYGHDQRPESIRVERTYPNTGIFKVGRSERLDIDPLNWFDFLVEQGFTVATWSQPGKTFADAYPSAEAAFEQLLTQTAALNPSSPPPVALIGHSRGGLIIRKLLKEKGSRDRVRWMITLHSPHHGSELAARPEHACATMLGFFSGGSIEKQMLRAAGLDDEFRAFCRGMNEFLVDAESRELAPGSALLRGLAQGEAALPGVRYHTFGGTRPTYIRYYAWPLSASSALPQYKVEGLKPKQYFIWEAKPVEIALISPLFDEASSVAPELRPGKGDGLVTDQSARLPFSTSHVTTDLNHAEVLWDRSLQRQVAAILEGPRLDPGLKTTIRLPGGTR